ncbi:hypothetical protein GCM10010104_15590 [Streptomyces indiaensis]|uniref:Uncharacterized protein n=1 Tax=Streptomyces indiaensis TaxID=284033 RepID=A0ABN3D9M8_9ACTN
MSLPEEQRDPRTRERLALAPHEPGGGVPNIFTPHLIAIVMPVGQYRMMAFFLNATVWNWSPASPAPASRRRRGPRVLAPRRPRPARGGGIPIRPFRSASVDISHSEWNAPSRTRGGTRKAHLRTP